MTGILPVGDRLVITHTCKGQYRHGRSTGHGIGVLVLHELSD